MYVLPFPELRLNNESKSCILSYIRNDLSGEEHWWRRGSRDDEEKTMAYWHLVRPHEPVFEQLRKPFNLNDSDFMKLNATIEFHRFQPSRELKPHKDLCRNAVIIYPIYGYEDSVFSFHDGPKTNYQELFSVKYRDTPLMLNSDVWHSMIHVANVERISITYSFHNEHTFDRISELYNSKSLFRSQIEDDYLFPSEEPDPYGQYDERRKPYPESF